MIAMKKQTISAQELFEEQGFKLHQAREIVRQAKELMVSKGFSMYNNKRLGVVPRSTVELITGIPLVEEEIQNDKDE